jgi:hypothetical protein
MAGRGGAMILQAHRGKDLYMLQVDGLTLLEITGLQVLAMKEAVERGYKLNIGIERSSSVELEDIKLLEKETIMSEEEECCKYCMKEYYEELTALRAWEQKARPRLRLAESMLKTQLLEMKNNGCNDSDHYENDVYLAVKSELKELTELLKEATK